MNQQQIHQHLLETYRYNKGCEMNVAEREAAALVTPVSNELGNCKWQTSNGDIYNNGFNAIVAQLGINRTVN